MELQDKFGRVVMNKWAIIGGVGLIVVLGWGYTFVYDKGYQAGKDYERAEILRQSGDSTTTSHPNTVTTPDVEIKKRHGWKTDEEMKAWGRAEVEKYRNSFKWTVIGDGDEDLSDDTSSFAGIRMMVRTPDTTDVVIGSDSLNVRTGLVDLGESYLFTHPTFTYPSRKTTFTKYLERPVPFFDGIEFGMMLSSSFKHFSVEGTPYVSLPLNFGGTKISSWIGYRISEQEPQARYGVVVTFENK